MGRYLWVVLELEGNEFASPRVDAVRATFPRQSYLRYLPAVFGSDAESAEFLERFLSLFETVFDDVEAEITGFTAYLDARGVPTPYLSWLERWLAVDTDETWSTAARHELLANAPGLYRARGTRTGLVRLLRVYLEADDDESVGPYVLEHADLDGVTDPETRRTYERFLNSTQGFLVLVGPYLDDERVRTVGRIVEAERPAHAVGRGVGLQPRTRLGDHAYLGLNTVLPRPELVLGRSRIGEASVLRERDPRVEASAEDGA